MLDHQKPLHTYEQSMLLVAMLFDSKNLSDILDVLPASQKERMQASCEKFHKLPRNVCLTEVVFELRRLLLIDEHRIDWIHQSWIDDALAKEPTYLRALIAEAIVHGARVSARPREVSPHFPLPLIFSTFIDQLTKTPQKTAIYDPVLMRLQALKDEAQEEAFAFIGQDSISAVGMLVDKVKFSRILFKRGCDSWPCRRDIDHNPFANDHVRRFFIRTLTRKNPSDCAQLAGLITVALYLHAHKHQWQRAIVLGLHIKFGRIVEDLIESTKKIVIAKELHGELSSFLLASFNHLR